MSHPSDRIRGTSGDTLAGRRIVLGVAGSIAAVKTVELARELIRHGADVLPVMTPAAARIIHPDALEFATGHAPVLRLTGLVEHVRELGVDGDADLFLVAPATANTITKMALGIDDTAVTTCATVAVGAKRPVLVAPAMHGPMEDHPQVQKHLEALTSMGVEIVRPKHEEGKAKLASKQDITAACARALGPHTLAGKRILVVSGGSAEAIDPVRVMTNRSSGRMGVALAQEAYRLGAEVTVVTTNLEHAWPPGADLHLFSDVRSLIDSFHAHLAELAPDIVLVPAALSDYAADPLPSKMSSELDEPHIPLRRLPKALPVIRDILPHTTLVSWKLQDTLEQAIVAARTRLETGASDMIVANGADNLADSEAAAVLVAPFGEVALGATKQAVARALWAEIIRASNAT